MPKIIIALTLALTIAASVGIVRADTVYLPAISLPPPTAEPTATPTATTAPTPTSTATAIPTQMPTITPTATEVISAPCACGGNFYNCRDFINQPHAQGCYNYCIQQGAGDVHQLDDDHDGIACESLPGGFAVVR